MPTRDDLKQRQSLPLGAKVIMAKRRIREFVDEFGTDGVYVSFSGGKDSTVLLHIVRQMYGNDIPVVFVDTGLEYPEIRQFVKQHENVTILRPKMGFADVIIKHGYPIISKEVSKKIDELHSAERHGNFNGYAHRQFDGTYVSKIGNKSMVNVTKWKPLTKVDFFISHMCCNVMKKTPAKEYEQQTGRKPILAIMAAESRSREQQWIRQGCNVFDSERPESCPMSIWTDQDIYRYIIENCIPICSVYGDIIPESGQFVFDESQCKMCTSGCYRTGCIFCGFGAHLEKGEGRFQRLKKTHPKQWKYCIEGGAYDTDGLWKPDKNGLGMRHVFDTLNRLYGKDFIRYE